jgi:FkbM family methyltransferase
MQQFGPLTLKHCRYGWMLYYGKYIGECFDLYGQYSESEVRLMRRFLHPGDTAIDVGAYIGDLSIPMSRIVGDAGRVFAFEAHTHNFTILCANLALNNIRNVRPINAFVVSPDTTRSAMNLAGFGGWPVDCKSLDALELDALHLLKIDVDGYELEVLKSAEMQIERFRPVLYFENDRREKSAPLLDYAMRLGYDLYFHRAPIFDPENFFGNPVNHWGDTGILSLMIVGIPKERKAAIDLRRVTSSGDWWDFAGSDKI